MNINLIELYFLMKLDTLIKLFLGMAFLFGCIGALNLIYHDCNLKPIPIKSTIRYCLCVMFFILLATITPTTKQMAAIMVIPKIINNEKAQDIPNKILDFGIEWMNELKPKGESK